MSDLKIMDLRIKFEFYTIRRLDYKKRIMPYILQITNLASDDNSGLPHVKISLYRSRPGLKKRVTQELIDGGIADSLKAAVDDLLTYGYYPLSDGYIAIKDLDYQTDMSVFHMENKYLVEERIKERTRVKKYPIGKISIEGSIRLRDSGAILGYDFKRDFFDGLFKKQRRYKFDNYKNTDDEVKFTVVSRDDPDGLTYSEWRKLIIDMLNTEQSDYETDAVYIDIDME